MLKFLRDKSSRLRQNISTKHHQVHYENSSRQWEDSSAMEDNMLPFAVRNYFKNRQTCHITVINSISQSVFDYILIVITVLSLLG